MHVLYAWRPRRADSLEVTLHRLDVIGNLIGKVRVEVLRGNHVSNRSQEHCGTAHVADL